MYLVFTTNWGHKNKKRKKGRKKKLKLFTNKVGLKYGVK